MSNILHSQLTNNPISVLKDIALNLKQLRTEKDWSQAALAERSGMSRRMISAIEGGNANISIQSMDQLAEALEVSFSRIVRSASTNDNRCIDSVVWQGHGAASSGKLLGAALATSETEFWLWSLQSGDRYDTTTITAGWQEMIYVLNGILTIELNEDLRILDEGEFWIFPAPRSFAYVNTGKDPLRFLRSVIN